MIFGKKAKTVAGLDIGASSIKLVELEERSGSFALTSLGMRELPLEVIVDEEIRDKDIVIFNLQKKGNIKRAVQGDEIGTLIR